MKIFRAEEIRQIDHFTILNEPISSIDLMERVAVKLSEEIMKRWDRLTRFIVFAGPGNNGGDALALARILYMNRYSVEVFLFNPLDHLSEDCENKKRRLFNLPEIPFVEVNQGFKPPILTSHDVVIDGLFGTGLNKPLGKGFDTLVQYINKSEAQVVSIDIPSGMMADNNNHKIWGNVLYATLTLTLQFPKYSFFFAENAEYLGEWKVLDIELHPQALKQMPSLYHYQVIDEMKDLLHKRERFAHKGTCGHALLIAGSGNITGAALLASKACLRSGVGLLTLHAPENVCRILQTSLPEALIDIDDSTEHFTSIQSISRFDSIGIGPGLGRNEESFEGLKQILTITKSPLVLDADALNLLSQDNTLFNLLPQDTILTPHPKEFDRLAGVKSSTGYERLMRAMEMAKNYHIIIVLKGANSAILLPNGECRFNSTGNAGMATAGMGDALTGVLTALLAQGYSPRDATLLGVFLHGLAGDLALENQSEESLITTDLIEHLGKAFLLVKKHKC